MCFGFVFRTLAVNSVSDFFFQFLSRSNIFFCLLRSFTSYDRLNCTVGIVAETSSVLYDRSPCIFDELVSVSSSGGFFVGCEVFGLSFDESFPAYTLFFFKVEVSLRAPVQLFRLKSVNRDSASGDNRGRAFTDELSVSSFP